MIKESSQSEFLISGSCLDDEDDSSKKNCKEGQWSIEENQLYLEFLEVNKTRFLTHEERKRYRVFEKVSQYLKNKRSPRQCRSHHQKIMKKSKPSNSIDAAIQYLKEILKKKMKKVEAEKEIEDKKDEKTKPNKDQNNLYQTDTYEYLSKVNGRTLELHVKVYEGCYLINW